MFIIIPSETCWDEETVSSRSSDLPKATPWVPDRARQPVVLSSFWATDFSGHLAKARRLHAHISQIQGPGPARRLAQSLQKSSTRTFFAFSPQLSHLPLHEPGEGGKEIPQDLKLLFLSLSNPYTYLPCFYINSLWILFYWAPAFWSETTCRKWKLKWFQNLLLSLQGCFPLPQSHFEYLTERTENRISKAICTPCPLQHPSQ